MRKMNSGVWQRKHVLVLCALMQWLGASGKDIFVDCDCEGGTHDGTSWETAYLTIGEALTQAYDKTDNIIHVRGDKYLLGKSLQGLYQHPLSLIGENADGTRPIVDGQGGVQCFYSGSAVVLRNLEFVNGVTDAVGDRPGGGAISLTLNNGTKGFGMISNCVIRNSRAIADSPTVALKGGGVRAQFTSVIDTIIEDCWITNTAVSASATAGVCEGGGLYAYGSPEIRNCIIRRCGVYQNTSANWKARGGGLLADGSNVSGAVPVEIFGCLIESNKCVNAAEGKTRGGGIGTAELSGCNIADTIVRDNAAGVGAGAYVSYNTTEGKRILRCSFARNRATSGAAGLWIPSGTVEDTLFENNESAGLSGSDVAGGLYMANGYRTGWSVGCDNSIRISGCVFRGNRSASLGAALGFGVSDCVMVSNCLFSSNIGGLEARGQYVVGFNDASRDWLVTDCVFKDNEMYSVTPDSPDPIFKATTTLTAAGALRNCCFAGNGAASIVYVSSSSSGADVPIENCTIAGNRVKAGSFALDYRYDVKAVTVRNTVISDNVSAEDASVVRNLTKTNPSKDGIVTHSFVGAQTDGINAKFSDEQLCNLIGIAPKFADADNGDFRLKSSSPLVGGGVFLAWMSGATNLGTGDMDVLVRSSGAGVRIVRKGGTPYPVSGPFSDIGCLGIMRSGLVLILR